MAITYEPIVTTTLTSNTTQIDFTSISSSYTDIVAVFNGTMTASGSARFRVNSNTSALYSNTRMAGTGTAPDSGSDSNYNIGIAGFFLANKRGMFNANFMNYSNTTTNKTVIIRDNSADYTILWVNVWRSTAAITSISFFCDGPTIYYTSGSTFTLYGIKAA